MLEVSNIHTFYGLSHILFDVSLKVKKGQVVCLLGRNGAGKTTTLKSIMGLNPPARGSIRFLDDDITGNAPYRLARRGMGYVPDDRRIFADLTVHENLEIAARKPRTGRGWDTARVYDLFPALKSMPQRNGGLLSGGEQKMLAIARALMGNPTFLLLDEPSIGLAPIVVREIGRIAKEINQRGTGILVVEQNARLALRLAHRGYVLETGDMVLQGLCQDLLNDHRVKKAYLGK